MEIKDKTKSNWNMWKNQINLVVIGKKPLPGEMVTHTQSSLNSQQQAQKENFSNIDEEK